MFKGPRLVLNLRKVHAKNTYAMDDVSFPSVSYVSVSVVEDGTTPLVSKMYH